MSPSLHRAPGSLFCAGLCALLAAGCERQPATDTGPTPTTPTRSTTVAVADMAGETTAPPEAERVDPKPPTYEDAVGVVKRDAKTGWVIAPDDGSTPVCAPGDLPADVTDEGLKVRFTLYAADDATSGCRPTEMLVSIRAVE